MPETSIIIRTRNEERWIGTTLKKLFEQTYKNFEVILVDSGSKDKTLEIARRFPVSVIEIPEREFSYPHALNVGMENSHGEFAVLLSAHSVPIDDAWLANGLRIIKSNEKFMGVYGFLRSLPGSTLADKIHIDLKYWIWVWLFDTREYVARKPGMGVLGFTNAIIRRKLWTEHRFDEAVGAGGEDGEWAGYWFDRGYTAFRTDLFTVRHSHGLGFRAWQEQYKHWWKTEKPIPFTPLKYRNDPAHRSDLGINS